MLDALSVVGGLAAGMQLVSVAAEALLATIKLIEDLQHVPQRLRLLLAEVDDSISRLCCSCNAGSRALQNLEPSQRDRLSRSISALYPALQAIHRMLTPIVGSDSGMGTPVHRLWRSLASLKVERELVERLERLNRLNIEVLRELSLIGLELQKTMNDLVVANNSSSSQALSEMEAKVDSLQGSFQALTLSIHRPSAITTKHPDQVGVNSQNGDPLPQNIPAEDNRVFSGPLTSRRPDQSGDTRLSQERVLQMSRYLARSFGAGNSSGESVRSVSQIPHANLDFVLYNIRTFYTAGNFDASPLTTKAQFWEDADLAIYLMRVSTGQERGASQSLTRGLRLLKKSTENHPDILNQHIVTVMIEIFSTLSPSNTATCPHVREALLRYLDEQAQEHLHCNHPITHVIKTLKYDKGDKYISIRALTFLAERLRATVGPAHNLTQLVTERLCTLLRDNGDFAEALRVLHEAACAIRALLGIGSLEERKLARQIEHVYMDQCDWTAALSVCFDVVGQEQFEGPDPDPRYHDECAVYTMEDIAKICDCAGDLELAAAWLKQAKVSGGMIWGYNEALGHIQDKLDELLKQTGKENELEIWNTVMESSFGK